MENKHGKRAESKSFSNSNANTNNNGDLLHIDTNMDLIIDKLQSLSEEIIVPYD